MLKRKQLHSVGLLFFVVLTFFYFPQSCFADTNPNNSLDLSPKTIEESLFKEWLTLNLYKKGLSKSYESEIINDNYFVSPIGRTNPLAELFAFKNKIRDFIKKGDGKSVLCRFPARMTLFAKYYDWFKKTDRPKCTDYIEQNKPNLITSVSLIHVTGYFDNPSSYYGHTLLRLNYQEDMPNQTSLDSSISYGAHVTDSISNPLYVINGLFGGYEARYRRNNQFLHTHNYTNNQIRDVWEYELSLTKEQVRFISEFVWELNNARFKYYFFNDNCAHRIAKIIELVTGINLSKSHGFWLLPMQVVRSLERESKKLTPPLIKQEKYHPSLKRIFFDRYKLLTQTEKTKFLKFLSSHSSEQREFTKTLKTKILLLIIDYLDIQVADGTSRARDEKLMSELQKKRSIVLSQLMRYQVQSIHQFPESNNISSSLLNSQPTSVVRVGYGIRESSDFAKISYRVANNDFLDSPDPKREISKFVMGKIETDVNQSSAKITDVTLIDIMNFNTSPLPMTISNEYSWGINVGYSQRSRVCAKCSTLGIGTKWGAAGRINNRAMLYALIGGRIHTKQGNRRGIVTIAPEIGGFINITKKSLIGFSATYHNDLALDNSEYFVKANAGFNISRSFDLRAVIESDGDEVTSIFSAGYYFD